MKKIRIGGVPEYFNLPVLLAKEQGKFREKGIDLIWQDIPEGTGKMVQSLADDSLDMVIALTEGMTKAIAQGNPSKIIHAYVQSPLIWGIHAASHSSAEKVEELKGKAFAISRYGSGSHLMAILLAKDLGWDESELKFEVVNNLDGAREALKNDRAHIFLWEKYTTKFLVDQGEFKRVGEYPTPWPCFVISATDKIIAYDSDLLKTTLDIIIKATASLKSNPEAVELIAKRYKLLMQDVGQFWPNTQWNSQITLPHDAIEKVLSTFQSLGTIDALDKPITHALK
jgi:sulfonate transport system substrate-binding protein